MTNEQVKEKLIEWLSGLLGLTVIKDRQQQDRPDLPYGMVSLANWREIDDHPVDEVFEVTEDTATVAPQINVEWIFLFFIYGPGCENYMRRLQVARHLHQPFMPELVIHEVSAPNTIPELINEVYEDRTQTNIRVRGVMSDTFDTEVIEHGTVTFEKEGA